HGKACGKKKPPKTRKVINRESYTRHTDKILNKHFEQRLDDQFRRLEDKLRAYRKRVEKHLASVDLYAANFQAKQKKAQVARDEEFAKLEKLIF
ncbi:hypothetical protein JG688_00011244, partial [Phytophthora aleatoria]